MSAVCLIFSACEEGPEQPPPQPEAQGGGSTTGGGGGGGDVQMPASPAAGRGERRGVQPGRDLDSRYRKALDRVGSKDWDGAYMELGRIVTEAPHSPVAAQAARQLQTVQSQLMQIPPVSAKSVLAKPAAFEEKALSLRGEYRGAGQVGASSDYFYLESPDGRVQCRYHRLHADAKRALVGLTDGTRLLVRGTLRSAGSPYLDVTLFKIE